MTNINIGAFIISSFTLILLCLHLLQHMRENRNLKAFQKKLENVKGD